MDDGLAGSGSDQEGFDDLDSNDFAANDQDNEDGEDMEDEEDMEEEDYEESEENDE